MYHDPRHIARAHVRITRSDLGGVRVPGGVVTEEMEVPAIKVTTEIELDIDTAAKWFAQLSDDDMCRFLVAVAEEAKSYPSDPDSQWFYLGGHLKNCKCSTDDAREMIRRWNYWMENSSHV